MDGSMVAHGVLLFSLLVAASADSKFESWPGVQRVHPGETVPLMWRTVDPLFDFLNYQLFKFHVGSKEVLKREFGSNKWKNGYEVRSTYIGGDRRTGVEIDNIQASDSGVYSISILGQIGAALSDNATVYVYAHPDKAILESSSEAIFEGDDLTLKCYSQSTSVPSYLYNVSSMEYSWRLNGELLDRLPPRHEYIALNAEELVIRDVNRQDNGTYTCQGKESGSNFHSPQSDPYLLDVLYRPGCATAEKNLTAQEGSLVRLVCHSKDLGNPEGHFNWKFLGRNRISNAGHLELASVTLEDGGDYQCWVKNSVGSGCSDTVHLTVLVPPRIHQDLQENLSVIYSENINASCSFLSRPACQVTWLRKETLEPLNSDIFEVSQTSYESGQYDVVESYLTWKGDDIETRRIFGGDVVCEAKNEASQGVHSSVMKLVIQYPPKIECTQPEDRQIIAHLGNDVEFNILVTASPLATISWKHNTSSKEVDIPSKAIARADCSNFTLSLSRLELGDFGTYTANVQNEIWDPLLVTFSLLRILLVPPPPPGNFSFEHINSVSVTVSWTSPSDSQPTGFIVIYTVDKQLYEVTDIPNPGQGHSVCLKIKEGVVAGENITVSVCSVNEDGKSEDVVLSNIQIPDLPIFIPNVNSGVTIHENNTVTIQWTVDKDGISHVLTHACVQHTKDCVISNLTNMDQSLVSISIPQDAAILNISFEVYDGRDLLLLKAVEVILPTEPPGASEGENSDFLAGIVVGCLLTIALGVGLTTALIVKKNKVNASTHDVENDIPMVFEMVDMRSSPPPYSEKD